MDTQLSKPDTIQNGSTAAKQVTLEPIRELIPRQRRSLRQWAVWLWEQIYAVGMRADQDHVFMLAAGVAFNIITSLVPMLLVILFVLGYVLDSDTVMHQLNQYASTYIVAEGYRDDIIRTLQAQVSALIENRGIAGIVGIGGMLWAASALAASIRVGVNRVLRCREERNYLVYKLYDMGAIISMGLLVFISVMLGPIMQLLMATSDRIGEFLNVTGIEGVVSELISIATALLLFYIIFRYIPYQKQERHIIWIGTLTSTILWEIARQVFGFYLMEFKTFARIYGAYAFFATAAIWIYYSALVFLIAAEVAYHVKQSRWNARRLFNRIAVNGGDGG